MMTTTTNKMTFDQLLGSLATIDDCLEDPDFDPAAFMGDISDKIDRTKAVLDLMDATISGLEATAKPLLAKAKSIKNNKDRLLSYLHHTMQAHNETALPGHKWRIEIKRSHVPALDIRAATDEDYSTYIGYVDRSVSYSWKKDDVKAALKIGAMPPDFPGSLAFSTSVKFSPIIPTTLEKKAK